MADESIDDGGFRLRNAAGLNVEFNANGSLRRFDHGSISLLLFVGNELEGGIYNLYLRRLTGSLEWTSLLGPESPTHFQRDPADGLWRGTGVWRGIRYSIALELAADSAAWCWRVMLENTTAETMTVDLTCAQDLALAPYGAVRMNEFYVSQYVDHSPLAHPTRGWVIATRQNQAADGRFPWCVTGSLREAVSFATDALQFYGQARRSAAAPIGLTADLPAQRLQHEHSMAILRDKPITLSPGRPTAAGFFGSVLADHRDASSLADLAHVDRLAPLFAETGPATREPVALPDPGALPGSVALPGAGSIPGSAASLFTAAPPLCVQDLTDADLKPYYPGPWRHEEFDSQSRRLSFFCGDDRHVVLRAKELQVLRPHGHMLRTGLHLTPDESALTSTVWMSGVFHSMITQGHVSINRFASTVHSYLGLFRSHGVRVFVELGGHWRLLDTPSVFDMTPGACRWIYRHEGGVIEVTAGVRHAPQLLTLSIRNTDGPARRFLVSLHVALNGDDGSTSGPALWRRNGDDVDVTAAPDSDVGRRFPGGAFSLRPAPGTRIEAVGGDELLFADGRSRRQPFVCLQFPAAAALGLDIGASLVDERSQAPWRAADAAHLAPALRFGGTNADAPRERAVAFDRAFKLAELIPWVAHNALVHYLSPRGLEQYSGGGWGTRDVCQGPVETLLALGRTEPIRDLLFRVMGNQNPDGDWPQWFMFFDRERGIRPDDSHGDIVFWPLLVLAQYVLASGDNAIWDEPIRFFDRRGPDAGEIGTLWEHARRALALIERRVIPGTALAAYGHGDWNDSLQPADPAMRERLCSAWTVTLNHQVLTQLARALRFSGRSDAAQPLELRADAIRRDFQRLLVVDDVLTGYALFNDGAEPRYLLHPRDRSTGVRFSSLAMIHAILEDLLTPAQIDAHLRVIASHLHASDGIRLFDRPMPYHGGPQRLFQRAESATYFGREIGLMYMHAHLRFAQALAHLGRAQAFFDALCQANPIGIRAVVPEAAVRQSNCYYSSSDAMFADRTQAGAEYDRVRAGRIGFEGGWRIYSSGAGITLSLIVRHFLGLGREAGSLLFDPVIPASLDGLTVDAEWVGHPIHISYRIGGQGCGVLDLQLNGQRLAFTRDANPHRPGAVRVAVEALVPLLTTGGNRLDVQIG